MKPLAAEPESTCPGGRNGGIDLFDRCLTGAGFYLQKLLQASFIQGVTAQCLFDWEWPVLGVGPIQSAVSTQNQRP